MTWLIYEVTYMPPMATTSQTKVFKEGRSLDNFVTRLSRDGIPYRVDQYSTVLEGTVKAEGSL